MLLDLLINTPLYVYWIFFSLLFVGIIQSKKRKQGIIRALIIPFILIFFSIYALIQDFSINFSNLFSWLSGIVFVIILNKFIQNQNSVKYFPKDKTFIIEGSYIPLFTMMLIFFTKYSVNALTITNSSVLDSIFYIALICLLYGVFTGMYMMRFFVLLHKIYIQR